MRLIDADKLVKTFCSHCVDHDECKSECMDLKIIKSMKTVDTERHGHWNKDNDTLFCVCVYKCSLCGGEVLSEAYLFKYCPYCGAKMERRRNNEMR